jgi:hypothetical protein
MIIVALSVVAGRYSARSVCGISSEGENTKESIDPTSNINAYLEEANN